MHSLSLPAVAAASRHNPIADCFPSVLYAFPIHGLTCPLQRALHSLGVRTEGEVVEYEELFVESDDDEEEEEFRKLEEGVKEKEKEEMEKDLKRVEEKERNYVQNRGIEEEEERDGDLDGIETLVNGSGDYFDYSSSSASLPLSSSSSSSSFPTSSLSISFTHLPETFGLCGREVTKRPAVNLDVTALISLSTNMCYGGSMHRYKQKILSFQVLSLS